MTGVPEKYLLQKIGYTGLHSSANVFLKTADLEILKIPQESKVCSAYTGYKKVHH